ncbi:MAG: glyoxalase, partial [Sediminibacterium sp.]
MSDKVLSIRPFIGAKNFERSREFYRDLGFEEMELEKNLCVYKLGNLSFYLQNAYVKDWIDNTMVFMEVADVESFYQELSQLN